MKKIKKICVITGTRAEYGLLSILAKKLQKDKKFDLQIICTGTHLSHEFGYTKKEIYKDKLKVDYNVNLKLGKRDNEDSICKALGRAFIGFSKAYQKLKPDIIVVLGDRYELLAAAYSATIYKIPICHIHGGESTIGAFDEATRHSITKMSHLHFVANQKYKKRVIQLGENPRYVHNVGGMGVDVINTLKLLDKNELEKTLKIKFNKKINFLIVFHPVTLEDKTSETQFKNLLNALLKFKNANFFFSQSNADPGAKIISKLAQKFSNKNKSRSIYFKSLGQVKFLSLLKCTDVLIGNSSSGILEAPYLKKSVVNIGDRQKNRLLSSNIINCKPTTKDITKAIKKSISKKFVKNLSKTNSSYGNGGASSKCIKILKKFDLQNILFKDFFDLKI